MGYVNTPSTFATFQLTEHGGEIPLQLFKESLIYKLLSVSSQKTKQLIAPVQTV